MSYAELEKTYGFIGIGVDLNAMDLTMFRVKYGVEKEAVCSQVSRLEAVINTEPIDEQALRPILTWLNGLLETAKVNTQLLINYNVSQQQMAQMQVKQ